MLSGAAFAAIRFRENRRSIPRSGISPTTQDFVTEAATSDMLEIQAGKIAQQRGTAGEKNIRRADGGPITPRPAPTSRP